MTSKNESELPSVADLAAPLVAAVEPADQPLLVALAERVAAERYRGWADEAKLAPYRDRLLTCAQREEKIAARIEALRPDAAQVQAGLLERFPDVAEQYAGLFAGLALLDQLTVQARGEHLGAATWRAFADAAGDEATRDCMLGCAELEEASAAVLEEIVVAFDGASSLDHASMDELEAGLGEVRASPRDGGEIRLIVRRPRTDAREIVDEGELDVEQGLVGDNWKPRGYRKTPDGSAHPDMQLNIMNARAAALVARSPRRWQLAGDQLFVDLDLSGENLPPGTRLRLGEATIEVTAEPHTGCKKFVSRFGLDAMKFVNSPVGRELNLRGINAKVVAPGRIRVGDSVRKAS